MWTIDTAPSTIFSRAEMMASACWRRHHGGDFGRIGQVVDTGFDHLDTGHRQPLVERVFELVVNRLAVRAERQFIVLNSIIVIGITSGNLTQCGVALHTHEIFEDVHEGSKPKPRFVRRSSETISKTAL